MKPIRQMTQSPTPAIRPDRTCMYGKASGARSMPSLSRADQLSRGRPGHVDAGVRGRYRGDATRHSGWAVCSQFSTHSQTVAAPEEVVVIR